ncbi:CAP domain-containing protein [Longispora fulva]|uniref:CAP domain-containing protein n=1 Tax=Longispora fulva TaxID=619741 RepID=UPI0036388EDB
MQTDASLAAAASSGDRTAFEELHTRHHPAMVGFVHRLTGDRRLADDIVRETFRQAWQERAAHFPLPSAVMAWLLGDVHRRALDPARRAGLPLDFAMPRPPDHVLRSVPGGVPGAGPEGVAEQRQALSLAWSALRGLAPHHRTVLELAAVWRLSAADIGEVLGVGRRRATALTREAHRAYSSALWVGLLGRLAERCPALDAVVHRRRVRIVPLAVAVRRHVDRCPECHALSAGVRSMNILAALYAAADTGAAWAAGDIGPGGAERPGWAGTTPGTAPGPWPDTAPDRWPAAGRGRAGRALLVAVAALTVLALVAGGLAYALNAGGPRTDAMSQAGAVPVPEAEANPSVSPAPGPSPTPMASPTPAPSPTKAPPTVAATRPPGVSDLEAQVLALVNQRRAEAGCQPVRYDTRLAKAAADHSADMVARGYFAHNTPDGVTPWDRAKAAGYPTPSAENIAAGNATAKGTMDQWMNSPGHRANILNCASTAMGVGRATGGSYRYYWTQMFGTK